MLISKDALPVGMKLTMHNGEIITAGMVLDCSDCPDTTDPDRKRDDPKTVVRCAECGKRHSTDSLVLDTDT